MKDLEIQGAIGETELSDAEMEDEMFTATNGNLNNLENRFTAKMQREDS